MSFNITEAHNQLIQTNNEYVASLEATAFDRKNGDYALSDEANSLIDNFLVDTSRQYEVFISEVRFLSIIELDGESTDAIETEDDLCYIVCCDSGLNIIGGKLSLDLEWDDIQYLMLYNDGDFTFMLYDGIEIYALNTHLATIFKELFLQAKKDDSFNIKVMQEI